MLVACADPINCQRVLGYWPNLIWMVPSALVLALAAKEERRRRRAYMDAALEAARTAGKTRTRQNKERESSG